METLLSKARARVDAAEGYSLERSSTPLSFRAGKLESINTRHTRGLGLRLLRNGRLGFASSTDFEAEDALLDAAMATAAHGDEVQFSFPEGDEHVKEDFCNPELTEASLDALVEFGEALAKRLQEEAPGAEASLGLERVVDRVRIMNTNGLVREEDRSSLEVSVSLTKAKEGDILQIGDSVRLSSLDSLAPERLIQALSKRLTWSARVVSAPTGQLPVVFSPGGAIALILPLMMGSSGNHLCMGMSPLDGRIGEQIVDERISIFDDATCVGGSVSRAFDDEGIRTRRYPLIDQGVFRSFYHSLQTAAMTDSEPTGNGYRTSGRLTQSDYRWQPADSASNLIVSTGEGSEEELLHEMGDGLLVDSLMGLGQGNLMAGDFSNNIGLGFLVKDGCVVGRVKNTMVAGNVYELLRDNVASVGGETEWVYGQLCTPAIALAAINVSA